jgi:DedD protein
VAKPEPKPVTKPEVKAEVKKPEPKPAADGRYVVQIGSFADEGRARDARAKLERAGLKNYTQAVETKDGKRIRVRAGPFASKAEAERAADKIKKLDLPGTVLSL